MLLLILFAAANVALGFFGRNVIKFSGFDISPAAIAILAWHGQSIILGAFVLTISYTVWSWRDVRYLWLTLPVTILVGYLALLIPNIYILVAIYHVIGGLANYGLQNFDFKYLMYVLTNLAANFTVARLYGLFI